MMVVYRADNLDQLLPYRERWDQLAGECPFRRWTWLSTWWKHYQEEGEAGSHLFASGRTLCVLMVVDALSPCPETSNDPSKECSAWKPCDPRLGNIKPETILAVAPWYLEHSVSRGNVLRLLGDGEVCSDHLSLLLAQEHQEKSISALARSLCELSDHWDLLQLTGIETESRGMQELLNSLEQRGCHLQRSPAPSRWSLDLPDCWDDFLSILSKSHRKQLRKLFRQTVDSGRTSWHLASMPENASSEASPSKESPTIRQGYPCPFDAAWEHLVNLHQRRRQSLGEPGCFASPAYSKFHREVAGLLLAEGRLQRVP